MDLVKFGIIGCGVAARYHVTAFKKDPNARVKFVAAHDVNERQLKRFAKFNKLTPYPTLDELLQNEIDAVLILLPHYLHASVTKAAAEAGKHVLCEKPMANTLEECDEMIAATKKAGVTFMIAENHRFLPAHQLMRDSIEKGLIGDVFLGRTYEGAFDTPTNFLDPEIWHFTYDKGGGGVVMDQGVHKFALLNWLLDDQVDSAQCWCGKAYDSPANKGEDNAIILLRYKRGAMVSVVVSSTTTHPLTNRTELHGTKGSILEDHSWDRPVQIYSSHEAAEMQGEFYSPTVEHGPFPKYYTISARVEDSYFADCVLNDITPEFTPTQAKDAVAVVLLAYLSAKKGTMATMDELQAIAQADGTRTILDGLAEVMQHNSHHLRW